MSMFLPFLHGQQFFSLKYKQAYFFLVILITADRNAI